MEGVNFRHFLAELFGAKMFLRMHRNKVRERATFVPPPEIVPIPARPSLEAAHELGVRIDTKSEMRRRMEMGSIPTKLSFSETPTNRPKPIPPVNPHERRKLRRTRRMKSGFRARMADRVRPGYDRLGDLLLARTHQVEKERRAKKRAKTMARRLAGVPSA